MITPSLSLTESRTPDMMAVVTFHLTNGMTVEFEDVNPDSIGPSAESPGVIGVEFENDPDRIVHVPFVLYWEIEWV